MSHGRTCRMAGLALALTLVMPPAQAFEALQDAVRRMPDKVANTPSGFMFEFLAPSAVASWQQRERPGVSDAGIGEALFRPGPAGQLTGIDFPSLDAVLLVGAPPDSIVYLAGPTIVYDAVLATYRARGLQESAEAGATIFARGEDFHVDLKAVDRDDPFGGDMGLAQRIAVVPGRVLAARAWTTLKPFLPMLGDPAAETYLGARLARMVGAAGEAAGDGMTAFSAVGLTLTATTGPADPLDLLDLAKPLNLPKPQNLPKQALPPYFFSVLIASEAADRTATVQIVLYYPSLPDAEAGAGEITARLQAFEKAQVPIPTYDWQAIADDPGAIGMVSVHLPASEGSHGSDRMLRSWTEAIFTRQFVPLDIFQ